MFQEVLTKSYQKDVEEYVERAVATAEEKRELLAQLTQFFQDFHYNHCANFRVASRNDTPKIEREVIKCSLWYLTGWLTANNIQYQFYLWLKSKVEEALLSSFGSQDALITALLEQLGLKEDYRERLGQCLTQSPLEEGVAQIIYNPEALMQFAKTVLIEEKVIVETSPINSQDEILKIQNQALALIKKNPLFKEDIHFWTKLAEDFDEVLVSFLSPLKDTSLQSIVVVDALCESYFGEYLLFQWLYRSKAFRRAVWQRFSELMPTTQQCLFDLFLNQRLLERFVQTEEDEDAFLHLILKQSNLFVDGTTQPSLFDSLLVRRNSVTCKLIRSLARGRYAIDALLDALVSNERVLFNDPEHSLFKSLCWNQDGCVILNKLISKFGHESLLHWLRDKPERLLTSRSLYPSAFDFLSKTIDGRVFLAKLLLPLCEEPQFFTAFCEPRWLFEQPHRMAYLLQFNLPVLTFMLSKQGSIDWIDVARLVNVFQAHPHLYEQVELRNWLASDLQGQRLYAHIISKEEGALFKQNLPLPDQGPILPAGFMKVSGAENPDDLSSAVAEYWGKIYPQSATYSLQEEAFQTQLEQVFSVLETLVKKADPNPAYSEKLEAFHNRLKLNLDNQTDLFFKRIKYLLESLTYLWSKQSPAIIRGFLKPFFDEIEYCHAGVNDAVQHAVNALLDGWRDSISTALTQAVFEFAMYHDDLLGVHPSLGKHTGGLMLQHLAELGIGVLAPEATDVSDTAGCRLMPASYQWLQSHIYRYFTRERCIQIVYDAMSERVKEHILQKFSQESGEALPYNPNAYCVNWVRLEEELLSMPFLKEIQQLFGRMAPTLGHFFDRSDEENYTVKLLPNFDAQFSHIFTSLIEESLQISRMITPRALHIASFSLHDSDDFSPSEKRALAGHSDTSYLSTQIIDLIHHAFPNQFELRDIKRFPKLGTLLQCNPKGYSHLNLDIESADRFLQSLLSFIGQRNYYKNHPFQPVPTDFEKLGRAVNEVLIGLCKSGNQNALLNLVRAAHSSPENIRQLRELICYAFSFRSAEMRQVGQKLIAIALDRLGEAMFTNSEFYHPDFAAGFLQVLQSEPEDALTLFLKWHRRGNQIDPFLNDWALNQSRPELIPVLARAIEKTPQLANRISSATVRALIAQQKFGLVYVCLKNSTRLTSHLVPLLKQQPLFTLKEKDQVDFLELVLQKYPKWNNLSPDAQKRIQSELTLANWISLLTNPEYSVLRRCVFRTGYFLNQWITTLKAKNEWDEALSVLKETAKRLPGLLSYSLEAFQLLVVCLKQDDGFKTAFKEQMELQGVTHTSFNRYFEMVYLRSEEYLTWIGFFPERLHQEDVLNNALLAIRDNTLLQRNRDYIWEQVMNHAPVILTLAEIHPPIREVLVRQMLARKDAMMIASRRTSISSAAHERFQKESQRLSQLHTFIRSKPELSTRWEQVFPEFGQAELLQAVNSSRRRRGAITQFGLWQLPTSEREQTAQPAQKRRRTLTGVSVDTANVASAADPKP
ncbi:hypothetical protein GCM10007966_21490 [Legionella impletisoli]|uniref:Uncharacterized protein n=1 Tax=Legionella impletisoli TaxID=343510 RepID=A0A917JYP2_9GAMM|nr:hypothetical protein GCM10007966_21490 [Legionella impletisoli]